VRYGAVLTDGQQAAEEGRTMSTTHTRPDDVEERLARLERRMRTVEERTLGVPADRSTMPAPTPAPVAKPMPWPPEPARPRRRPLTEAGAPAPPRDLERLFGGRVLAWVGGVAVLAGLALLFALGVSRGWVGPTERVALGAALSLALIALGLRRHGRHGRTEAARVAVAVGGAGLFLAIAVAARGYGLVSAPVGLALAGGVAAGLATIAVRWRSQSVAALGIVGALVAPMLVGATPGLTSLGFLLVVAVAATAVLLRERWTWLALVVVAVPALQWADWAWGESAPHAGAVLAVLVAFGALNVVASLGVELRQRTVGLQTAAAFGLGLNALLLAVVGWFALDDGHRTAGLVWLVALAVAHAAAGRAAGRTGRSSVELELFAYALALLLADVAVALLDVSPPLRAAVWAVSAVGLALLSRRTRGWATEGLVGLGLGGQIALTAVEAVTQLDRGDLFGSGSAGAAAVAGLVGLAAACLVSGRLTAHGHPRWREALDTTGLLAVALLGAMTLDGWALTAAWAGFALVLARLGARDGDGVACVGALAFLAAAGAWCLVDQAHPGALVSGDVALLPALLGIAAVSGVAFLVARLDGTEPRVRVALQVVASAGPLYLASLAVVAWAPSATPVDGLTVGEQGQLQLSALWAVVGVVALLVGLAGNRRTVRVAALGLLAVTVGKVFLFDLAVLTSVYRVASFLALGLLLLGAAFAYQRLRPGLAEG
jgi:uncharacterized membrane protein